MKLSKIVLENFKKHKSLEVDFQENYNLIVGPNYNGKSTVLHAVLFALFGTSAIKGNANDLVTDDAKNLEVRLALDMGLVITRSLKNCEVRMDEEVLARSHSACNPLIEEMLGVSKKQFLLNYYSKQGNAQALLDMDGAELVRHIEDCIGMDKLQKVLKQCNSVVTSSKAKMQALSEYLLADEDLQQYNQTIEEQGVKLEQLQSTLSVLQDNKVLKEGQVKALADKHDQLTRACASWLAYFSNMEAAQNVLDQNPIPEASSKYLSEQYVKVRDYETYLKSKEKLEASVDKAKREVAEAQEQLVGKTAIDISPGELRLQDAKDQLRENQTLVTRLKEQLHSSSCPTCKRDYDIDFDKDQVAADLDTASNDTPVLKQMVENNLSQLATDKRQLELFNKNTERVKWLQTKVSESEEGLAELSKVDPPESTIEAAQLLASSREAQRVETLRETAEEALIKPSPLDPNTSEAEVAEAKVELEFCQKSIRAVTEQVSQINLDLSETNHLLSISKDKVKFHEETRDKVDKQGKNQDEYSKIVTILQEVRKSAADSAWLKVMGVCSDFVKGATSGDVERVYLTENGITYEENGFARSAASCGSGAQKTLIGVGLKIGLSKVTPCPLKFVLLDEPTADMSEQVSAACLRLIGQYSDQVVAVTHRGMDTADNIIEL